MEGGPGCAFFFFFNDTATTEIYTLSLHDALPIFICWLLGYSIELRVLVGICGITLLSGSIANAFSALHYAFERVDRKSTRLNSSHVRISYAVFCLKKTTPTHPPPPPPPAPLPPPP